MSMRSSRIVVSTPYARSERKTGRRATTYGKREHALIKGPLLWNAFVPDSPTPGIFWVIANSIPVSDFFTGTDKYTRR